MFPRINKALFQTTASYLAIAIVMLSIIAAGRIIVLSPITSDSYTHAGVGRFIIGQKRIPTHANLSYKLTAPSLEWVTHSWLTDSIIYIMMSLGTNLTNILFLFPTLGISLWLLNLQLTLLTLPASIRLLSLSIAVLLGASFWKLHPLLFTVPLTLSITGSYVLMLKGYRQAIWALPVILVVWVQVAGGYIGIPIIFYAILLFYYWVGRLVKIPGIQTSFPSSLRFSTWIVVSVISLGVTLLQPLGARIGIYQLTLLSLTRSMWRVSSLPGALMTLNQNFLKSAPSSELYAYFLLYSLVLMTLVLMQSIRRRHILPPYYLPLLPLIVLLLPGIAWVRMIPLSVFGTLPLFASSLYGISRSDKHHEAILVVGYGIMGIISGYFLFRPSLSMPFDPPQKQLALIKQFGLADHVFTTFDLTGYVLYSLPNHKVFLDAQDDIFDDISLVNMYSWPLTTTNEFITDLINKNLINTMLVNKNMGGLAQTLTHHPDWALIYFDSNGFLFVKKFSVSMQFLEGNALRFVDLARNLGFDPDHLSEATREMESFVARYPENTLAWGQLATMYRLEHRYTEAGQMLSRIPKKKWGFKEYTEMGRILAAQGLCKSAETNFIQALTDRSERNYSRTVLDLAILYAGCLGDKDKAKHYFLRYNSFLITPPEREKLRQLMKSFDVSLE